MTRESMQTFIRTLDIPNDAKKRLLALTPDTYIGNAATQARNLAKIKI